MWHGWPPRQGLESRASKHSIQKLYRRPQRGNLVGKVSTHTACSTSLCYILTLPDQPPRLPTSQSVYHQGSDHQAVAVRNSSPQSVFHPSLWAWTVHSHTVTTTPHRHVQIYCPLPSGLISDAIVIGDCSACEKTECSRCVATSKLYFPVRVWKRRRQKKQNKNRTNNSCQWSCTAEKSRRGPTAPQSLAHHSFVYLSI